MASTTSAPPADAHGAGAGLEPVIAAPVPQRAGAAASPSWGLAAVAVAVAAAFATPLAYLVVRNVELGADMVDTITSSTTLEPLGRSLLLGVTVALSAAVVATVLAWCTVRTDLPGRRLLRVLAPLPLVLPSFVGAAAFLAALAPGGLVAEALGLDRTPSLEGFWGAWLVLTLFTYPYVYLPVAARLAGLPPSLEESARLLGRRPLAVFRTVVWPQTSSAVWAGALLVFLYTISDFGAVELMRYGTLTREIFASKLVPATSLPLALVLAAVALVVVVAERRVSRRRPRTATLGTRPSLRVPLGRWRWPALAVVAGVLLLALVAPVAVLASWAWRGLTSGGSGSVSLSVDAGELVVPALNTVSVSLAAAVVAVAVVLPVAYLTTRYRSRVGGAANTLVVAGFALPGLVVALALVFWVLGSDAWSGLYQTVPVLIFAYVVHFGAQAMRAGQVTVGSVPSRLDDAARVLGARRPRRFRTVDVPLMLPGLAAAGGLVLLSSMKELPATLLLAPPGFDTLATKLWSANESRYFAEVGLAGLVLVALSGALTWLLVLRHHDGQH